LPSVIKKNRLTWARQSVNLYISDRRLFMELVFNPPVWVLIVCIAITVVGIPAVLLKRGSRWQKIAGIAVIVIIDICLLFFFYKKHHFIVDANGIETNIYGTVEIPWNKVTTIKIIESLADSAYKPVMKMNGVGLGTLRYGWFKLKNGETAYVYEEQSRKGVLVKAGEKTYVFAINQIEELIAAVLPYISVLEGVNL